MNWFNNLKISQKLLLWPILVTLFIGNVGINGILSMGKMNNNLVIIIKIEAIKANLEEDIK